MKKTNKPEKFKAKSEVTKKSSNDIWLMPIVNSTNLVSKTKSIPKDNVEDIFHKIKAVNEEIFSGDLNHLEDMLLNQAHVLESIFYSFTEKMLDSKYMEHLQVYAQTALKAQKQCRDTLSALADLKKPKHTSFIKQQNNAINQQVNNLENKQKSSIELLEPKYEPVDA